MRADITLKPVIKLIPKFKSRIVKGKFSIKFFWLFFDLEIDNH